MLRFRPASEAAISRQKEWPDFDAEKPSTVFSPRPPLRKLVVVIDQSGGGSGVVPYLPLPELERVGLRHPAHRHALVLEDEQARVVRALDDVSVDVDDPAALENLLLRLHIALSARE